MTAMVVDQPSLSIITVVYNSEKHIERTILSILGQTYQNIEYIIIDGQSKDNTLAIIKKYEAQLTWVSERDKGIYDAMNKGIQKATGDFLLFINSGDEIYSKDTIQQVFSGTVSGVDVYYGETEIFNETWESQGDRRLKAPQKLNWQSLKDGMLVCHQSFIVRRSIAPYYNLKYKLAADFEWMLKCLKSSQKIQHTGIYMSKYMSGGQSRQNTIQSLKERFKIMVEHYGLMPVLFNHLVISFKFFKYVFKNKKIN